MQNPVSRRRFSPLDTFKARGQQEGEPERFWFPFVVSLNLNRRHLSESQRAMVAASLANMTHGGDRISEQAANLPDAISQPQAAELLQVSERSVRTAKHVERTAPAEVIEAVKAGNISLNMAAQVSKVVLA